MQILQWLDSIECISSEFSLYNEDNSSNRDGYGWYRFRASQIRFLSPYISKCLANDLPLKNQLGDPFMLILLNDFLGKRKDTY